MLVWRAPCTWYHISKCSKFHPCSLQAILHAWNKLFVVLIDLPQLPQATSTPTSLDSLKHHKNTAKLWGCLHPSGVVVEQTLSALNLWKKNPPEDTCEKLERFNKWKPEIHQCEIKKNTLKCITRWDPATQTPDAPWHWSEAGNQRLKSLMNLRSAGQRCQGESFYKLHWPPKSLENKPWMKTMLLFI